MLQSDFEKRATKYTYDKFVSELAKKPDLSAIGTKRSGGGGGGGGGRADNDNDDDDDDDVSIANLLPPAPSEASVMFASETLTRRKASPGGDKND